MNKEEFIAIPRFLLNPWIPVSFLINFLLDCFVIPPLLLDGNFGGLLISSVSPLVFILSEKEKIILFDSRQSHKLALSCAPALKS